MSSNTTKKPTTKKPTKQTPTQAETAHEEGHTLEVSKMFDYTSRFNTKPEFAAHTIEVLRHLADNVEGFNLEEAYKLFDKLTLDEREKHIKDKKRTERRNAGKFKASVDEPPTVRELYRKKWRQERNDNHQEYNDAQFKEAYANLDAAEQAALREEHAQLKATYEAAYNAELQQAVLDGERDEPRPKAVQNEFFMLKALFYENPAKYMTKSEAAEFAEMKAPEQSKFISAKYRSLGTDNPTLLQTLTDNRTVQLKKHVHDMYEWELRCVKRKLARAERLGLEKEHGELTSRLVALENNPPEDFTPSAAEADPVAAVAPAASAEAASAASAEATPKKERKKKDKGEKKDKKKPEES